MRLPWRREEPIDNPFLALPRIDPQRTTWRDLYFVADFLEMGSIGRAVAVIAQLLFIATAVIVLWTLPSEHASYLNAFITALLILAVSACSVYGFACLSVEIRRRWAINRRWPIYLYLACLATAIPLAVAQPKYADRIMGTLFFTTIVGGGPVYGMWRLVAWPARQLWRRRRTRRQRDGLARLQSQDF